jgi:hypothetical protein
MFPYLPVPALIQEAPALPPCFTIPEGLQIKAGSLHILSYDQETFEVLKSLEQAPLRLPVKGRTWRFILESSGVRMGILSLMQMVRPALEANGWAWQWEQRGVARRNDGDQAYWIKVSPSGGAALQVALVRQGPPTLLTLVPPGTKPEMPAPDKDFSYVTPWPGSTIVASAPSKAPVAADLGGGRQGFVTVNWIEKDYVIPDPPSSFEFVTSYRQALEKAGWEIDGDFSGDLIQVQATYLKYNHDIRLTLQLVGDRMAVTVADVGAQL